MNIDLSLLWLLLGLLSFSVSCGLVRTQEDNPVRWVLRLWPVVAPVWVAMVLSEIASARLSMPILSGGRWEQVSSAVWPALVVALFPHRFRPHLSSLIVVALCFVVWADEVHYAFLHWIVPLEAWTQAAAAWEFRTTWLGALTPAHAVYLTVALFSLAIPLGCRPLGERRSGRDSFHWAMVIVLLALATPSAYKSYRLGTARQVTELSNVRRFLSSGVWFAHQVDVWRALTARRRTLSEQEIDDVRLTLQRRRTGGVSGSPTSRNVLFLQVESFNAWLLDAQVNQQPVMPRLHTLRRRGHSVNLLDQTASGHSSDGDLLALCSLHPLPHVPVAFGYPDNHPVCLPAVLRDHGWTTLAITCDSPWVWMGARRRERYGFERCLYDADLEHPGPALCDRVLLDRLPALLRPLPKPFFVWAVTLSMHSPFTSDPKDTPWVTGPLSGTKLGKMLDVGHHTDEAIGKFLETIETNGLLKDTIVVVYGDHVEKAGIESELVVSVLPSSIAADVMWENRVAALVLGPLDPTRAISSTGGLVDLAPTVLDVLSISRPSVFLGKSLFALEERVVTRWDGAACDDATCWTRNRCLRRVGEVAPGHCDELVREAREVNALSTLLHETDVSQRLERGNPR